MTYTTVKGDMLDAICFKRYQTLSVLSQVLDANPGLAAHGPLLPEGLTIFLPEFDTKKEAVVSLWD